jgi:tRNA 2-thiouridine synthesizing protein A
LALRTDVADAVVVDARGHRCPTPTLRLRRALERAAVDDLVLVLADDPLALIDLPHFARVSGHALVEITTDAGLLQAVFRKGQGAP